MAADIDIDIEIDIDIDIDKDTDKDIEKDKVTDIDIESVVFKKCKFQNAKSKIDERVAPIGKVASCKWQVSGRKRRL